MIQWPLSLIDTQGKGVLLGGGGQGWRTVILGAVSLASSACHAVYKVQWDPPFSRLHLVMSWFRPSWNYWSWSLAVDPLIGLDLSREYGSRGWEYRLLPSLPFRLFCGPSYLSLAFNSGVVVVDLVHLACEWGTKEGYRVNWRRHECGIERVLTRRW